MHLDKGYGCAYHTVADSWGRPQSMRPNGYGATRNQRAASFCPLSVVSNRFYSTPTNSKTQWCYAGPGAFTRRDDAPFSPPRPHWFNTELGRDRKFPPNSDQEGKRKSEVCLVQEIILPLFIINEGSHYGRRHYWNTSCLK